MAKSDFTIQNSAQNNVTKKDYGMFLHVLLYCNGTISTLSHSRYDNSKLHVSSKFQLIDQGTLHFTCSEEMVF